MIKNLLLILGPFAAIRLYSILMITGYRTWHLFLDVPLIALMAIGAWAKTRADRKWKDELQAVEDLLKRLRQ